MLVAAPSPEASRLDREPGSFRFVWGVWALMTALALGFVGWFGTNIPVWDDENLVPEVAGSAPITVSWLWSQCNEHRIPLPKLILVLADRAAGRDFRAGMVLSVVALAVLAALLLILMDRLPGGLHAADAFFPILLLHWGHATNLLWSFQFSVILPTLLTTSFLLPMVGRRGRLGGNGIIGAGLALTCLPLCGGHGLIFVPPLACWLVGLAVLEWRANVAGSRRRASLMILATVPATLLTAWYFRGFRAGTYPEPPGGLADRLRAALQFVTGGVGVPSEWGWPISGLLTLGLALVVLASLTRAWIKVRGDRTRIFGLLMFLGGVAILALAVGWNRGWAGDLAGFQRRYVVMATPFWCWLVVAARLAAPRVWGQVMTNILFALICCLAWPNTELGWNHARDQREQARSLTNDIRGGMPPFRLIRRHTPYLHPSHDRASALLPILRAGAIGPFAGLTPNPSFREISIPLEPTSLSLVNWEAGGLARVTGVDPKITFTWKAPRDVAGIRIDYDHANPSGSPARFQMSWGNGDSRGADESRRYSNWNLPTGSNLTTTIWLDATIDRIQIQPDNQPGTFRIKKLSLLIPEASR